MDTCSICGYIQEIKNKTYKYFVRELSTGYVICGEHQYFYGYVLFLSKEHQSELHFLDQNFRVKFLEEMTLVAQAVYNGFKADKINYELLGNGSPHLHWHIFPRQNKQPGADGPVWWTDRNIMFSEKSKIGDEGIKKIKTIFNNEMDKLISLQ